MKKVVFSMVVFIFGLIACKENQGSEPTPQLTVEMPLYKQQQPENGVQVTKTVSHLNFSPDVFKMKAFDKKADTIWPGDDCNCPVTLRSFRGEFEIFKNGRRYGATLKGETYLNFYLNVENPKQMDKKHLDTVRYSSASDGLSYEEARALYQQIRRNKNNLLVSMVVTDQSSLGFLTVDSLVIRKKDSRKILWQTKQYEGHLWGNRE